MQRTPLAPQVWQKPRRRALVEEGSIFMSLTTLGPHRLNAQNEIILDDMIFKQVGLVPLNYIESLVIMLNPNGLEGTISKIDTM